MSPLPGPWRLFISDFDGTLKSHLGQVDPEDCRIMRAMGKRGIVRAVATGRSLFSFMRDWPADLELDYLIYSSGMALCRWTPSGPGEHVFVRSFPPDEQALALAAAWALEEGLLAFLAPPESHHFYFRPPPPAKNSAGFEARLKQFRAYARPWPEGPLTEPLSQLLFMIRQPEVPAARQHFQKLAPGLSLTRSASPYADSCQWLEVFPAGVSKRSAAEVLAELAGCRAEETAALGNDFNDEELLAWAGRSFTVPGAPAELSARFEELPGPGPILAKVWQALGLS
ncbi:MAG: Cof-type HAD-IIB family hydrolase [Deltaproteobacteria bacterium]|nr:Cof-type HAD-IIB family hydrolase [Deltaproteobacteria bacterium]